MAAKKHLHILLENGPRAGERRRRSLKPPSIHFYNRQRQRITYFPTERGTGSEVDPFIYAPYPQPVMSD